MEITKREIIISISISAVMLIIGLFISGKITDIQNDRNAEYQKAVHIEDSELFRHGMDTDIGNAFVYGDLQAVDAVTFDEIGGEYLYVEKLKRNTPCILVWLPTPLVLERPCRRIHVPKHTGLGM